MKISDLKASAGSVEVEGTITEKSEPREVITKFGKRLNVADATLSDDSGSISFSLWEDNAANINVGDKIRSQTDMWANSGERRSYPQGSTARLRYWRRETDLPVLNLRNLS